ncbi:MAG TPA: glycosyltransferase family 4 protein [Thermoanaerobaculia bacterium]|nr:glycosyltransferase family 4 protein [Thermoanaerobaculia bacterium]
MTQIPSSPRVAVVYPTPFGEEGIFGGGERYALELARELARRTPTRLVTFGSRTRRAMDGPLEISVHEPLRWVRGQRHNPFSVTFLADLARTDVIHCVAWNTLATDLAVLFARATRKKVFVTDVGGGASVTLGSWLPITRWVDRFLLIAEEGAGTLVRDRWSVLFAGIDVDRFHPAADVRRDGVLFVGRLLPHKGIDTLIAAVDPEVPLHIVGRRYDDDYFNLLQRLAAGRNVTFVTGATDEEILTFYQSAAVAVHPSVNRTVYGDFVALPELLGFTAMEAMACGTPVVVSRVGGMHHVVDEGTTGYLVPPSDPEALRDRLHRLLDDPLLARRMGEAARRRIEQHFTWGEVARRCLEAYGR